MPMMHAPFILNDPGGSVARCAPEAHHCGSLPVNCQKARLRFARLPHARSPINDVSRSLNDACYDT